MAVTELNMEKVGSNFDGLNGSDESDHTPRWKVQDRIVQGASRKAPSYTMPSAWKGREGDCYLVGYTSDGTASRELFVWPLKQGEGLVFGQPGNPTPVEVAGFDDSYCELLVEDHRRIVRIHTPTEGASPELLEQKMQSVAQAVAPHALRT